MEREGGASQSAQQKGGRLSVDGPIRACTMGRRVLKMCSERRGEGVSDGLVISYGYGYGY